MLAKTDVLICGGGIIGLAIARELIKKRKNTNIVVLEKEHILGAHASGRNSGVLHAGIYYTPDSLKAQFCLKGNILMKKYCREKGIPVLESGKVIVARNEQEIPVLEELYQRALKNGTEAELIEKTHLKDIEPYAKTCRVALYSPQTAVIDPHKVLQSVERDLISSGRVKVLKGFKFKGLEKNNRVLTEGGSIDCGLFINAAGACSDIIAHVFGVGLNYKIIPFKGTYKKLKKEKGYLVKGMIYPVPDLRNPFLGVHFTRVMDGTVYVGPTAIPALGRENYRFLEGIEREVFQILFRNMILFLKNPQFRKVALVEPKKYGPWLFFKDIKDLVEGLSIEDIEPSSKVGIRPQLVDWTSTLLVSDFVVLKSENSIHILNAVSPGFTSAMAFAEYVVEKYIGP
jgi:L-2-hydroxyglutarate oxidase LhgO